MSFSHKQSRPLREFYKCQKCRNDRKSCKPTASSRCERCERIGYPCSPSTKTRVRGRPRRLVDLDQGAQRLEIERSPSAHGHCLPTTFTADWLLGRTVDFGRSSYALAVITAAQRLLIRCRRDLESCLNFQLSPYSNFVGAGSKQCWSLCQRLKGLIGGLQDHQLFGHQKLWSRRDETHRPSTMDILSSVDQKSGDFKVLLCSTNVLVQDRSRECLDDFTIDYYESTETALESLMDCIPDTHGYDRTTCQLPKKAFPAWHIAYMNMDKDAAFKLWKRCTSTLRSDVDILGRTFPHLLAEAGDFDLLSKVEAPLLRQVKLDARSLSLLDLAIISDSFLTVKTIIEAKIEISPFTLEMQTAICMRRSRIAKNLLLPYFGSTHLTDFQDLDAVPNLYGECDFSSQLVRIKSSDYQGSISLNGASDFDFFNQSSAYESTCGFDDLDRYVHWNSQTPNLQTSLAADDQGSWFSAQHALNLSYSQPAVPY